MVSYLTPTGNLYAMKAFRLMKVFRPLRLISRNEGLMISMRALNLALPGITNIIIASLMFYFIFGIIGISYYRGKYYNCVDILLTEEI